MLFSLIRSSRHVFCPYGRKKSLIGFFIAHTMIASGYSCAAELSGYVTDSQGKPLNDAVIFATPKDAKSMPFKHAIAIMDQQNKELSPYVLPIQVGTSVAFYNNDNTPHSIYSFSPTKKFNLPLFKGAQASSIVFDKPGIVTVGCNIHDWSMAYIYVLNTPYFAKTDEDGKAHVADLPAGKYMVNVWHPRKQQLNAVQEITLSASEFKTLAFRLNLKPQLLAKPRVVNFVRESH